MKRREFIAAAALLAAGCAAPGAMGGEAFRSDRINVVTQGSGPDVVLVHGLGSSRDVGREMIAAVPGYRYHLVQMSGFGGTPIGESSRSFSWRIGSSCARAQPCRTTTGWEWPTSACTLWRSDSTVPISRAAASALSGWLTARDRIPRTVVGSPIFRT